MAKKKPRRFGGLYRLLGRLVERIEQAESQSADAPFSVPSDNDLADLEPAELVRLYQETIRATTGGGGQSPGASRGVPRKRR